MTRHAHSDLPVLVLGAGPVGLAAAARLHQEGLPFAILEAGDSAGAAVRAWQHVRLFTPWQYLIDDAARSILGATDWTPPDPDHVPTGGQLLQGYLLPLAEAPVLAQSLHLGMRATAIVRAGADKLKSSERDDRPFIVYAIEPGGEEHAWAGRAVIDATGTCASPNPLGSAGVPAIGERTVADRLYYGIPDVVGRDRARFSGRHVGVVGSGHSAFNTLLDLQELHESDETTVTWFVRGGTEALWGGEDADALSERGALGRRMRELAESGRMKIETSFATSAVERDGDTLLLVSSEGYRSEALDEVVVVTGFRPDLDMTRELRLDLDAIVEAPSALAPLIDPNLHSCGTVPPHGYRELSHPEVGYYSVGMKSYGRAPTFLMITGYEQVRSVVKAIAGDLEAAAEVHLVLPETGVCSAPVYDLGADEPPAGDACCAPSCCEPAPVGIGAVRARTSTAREESAGDGPEEADQEGADPSRADRIADPMPV